MNRATQGPANRNTSAPINAVTDRARARARRIPARLRRYCRAPTFWPTKVVMVMPKALQGSRTKRSSRMATPMPAEALVPKELMYRQTNRLEMAIMAF